MKKRLLPLLLTLCVLISALSLVAAGEYLENPATTFHITNQTNLVVGLLSACEDEKAIKDVGALTLAPDVSKYALVDGVLYTADMSTIVLFPPRRQGTYTIPASVTTIGPGAFVSCSDWQNPAIPDTVTKLGEHAFNSAFSKGQYAPKYLVIPKSIKNIPKCAFYMSALQSFVLEEGVETIGEQAFYGRGYMKIQLPESLTSIDGSAIGWSNKPLQFKMYCKEGSYAADYCFYRGIPFFYQDLPQGGAQ